MDSDAVVDLDFVPNCVRTINNHTIKMKNIITILILFVAVGCGKSEAERLEDSVVGTYEGKIDGYAVRLALLDNGVLEWYKNGKKIKKMFNQT